MLVGISNQCLAINADPELTTYLLWLEQHAGGTVAFLSSSIKSTMPAFVENNCALPFICGLTYKNICVHLRSFADSFT